MSDNNITKLIKAFIGPGQTLEDVLQQLYTARRVDTAENEQLNVLGRLVGRARNGLDDADYRRQIRATIAANRSKGTIEDLIKVASLIVYDDAAVIVIDNHGPAAVTVEVSGVAVDFQTSATLALLLQDAVAAGVRLFLETTNVLDADAFTFDSFVADPDPAQGFESYDGLTGGKLGSVI